MKKYKIGFEGTLLITTTGMKEAKKVVAGITFHTQIKSSEENNKISPNTTYDLLIVDIKEPKERMDK